MAVLKATKRDNIGSRAAQSLRKEGLIPGVIYGHGLETQSVTLQKHEMELAILHGERLLEVDCEGNKENVLIKELQYDTFGQHILHVDLTRVNLDDRIEVTVQVTLRGTPEGVSSEGGMLQHLVSEVHVECLAGAIPADITVLVRDMKVGDNLTAGDLPLPDGAKLLGDPAAIVASVRVVAEEEEAPAEVEEGGAEPEVIGEKKEEEGEAAAE